MLRRQSLIALGVAIVLGLLAVYLANVFLNARERQLEVTPEGMSKVAVASVPLDYGVAVTPDKVKFVNYPNESLPPGTFPSMAVLLPQGQTRVALRPIQVNQPLLASDLTGEGQAASIASLLPDGMRAATVRINDVSGVAGFVKANDTVDVLITRQAIGGDERVTDVLLQNVRVIAMDQQAKNPDGKPAKARTATLEVTPVDAQKLALGQQLGSLSLVLRKPGEENNIPLVETVSLDDLRYSYGSGAIRRPDGTVVGGAPPPGANAPKVQVKRVAPAPRRTAPVARNSAPPPPATRKVEVLRGTQSSEYEVGGYGGR